MDKSKIFVSYDHSGGPLHKNLLRAWDANPDFDFEFDSRGPNVLINPDNAAVVKANLAKMMKTATHLLVLVGAKTAASTWVNWEIGRAKKDEVRLKLAAVKLSHTNASPVGLLNVGCAWATSFGRDRIIEALDQAKAGY